jgi:hypothetical protein
VGRGWAIPEGDVLGGMIFFHQGDEPKFLAGRADSNQGIARE